MALNFPNTGLYDGYQYTGDNGVIYIYDGVKWVGHAPNTTPGTNSITNGSNTVQVDGSGNLVTPAYTFPGTVGTDGQVLTWPASGTTLEWQTQQGGGGGIGYTGSAGDPGIGYVGSAGSNGTIGYTGSAGGGGGGITAVVQDTGPQLGGNLDLNNHLIVGGSYAGNTLILPVGGGATLTSGYEGGVTLRASTSNTNYATWNFAADGTTKLPSYLQGTTSTIMGDSIALQVAPGPTWLFDYNGLAFPTGAQIADISGLGPDLSTGFIDPKGITIGTGFANDITITTSSGIAVWANSNLWQFGADGTTLLPTILAGDTSIGTAFNTNPPGHTLTLRHNNGTGSGSGGQLQFDYGTAKISIVKDAGNPSTWEFNTDGTLTLPLGGDILDSTGETVLGFASITDSGYIVDSSASYSGSNHIVVLTDVTGVFTNGLEVQFPSLPGYEFTVTGTTYDLGSNSTTVILAGDTGVEPNNGDKVFFEYHGITEIYPGTNVSFDVSVTTSSGRVLTINAVDQQISYIANGTSGIVIPGTDADITMSVAGAPIFGVSSYGVDVGTGWVQQGNSIRTQGTITTTVLGSSSTVVFSAPTWMTSIKLLLAVEGRLDGDGTSTDHTQTAEATIAMTYNTNAEPVMSVYGLIYTTVAPLATFAVRRTGTNGSGNIEVLATNSQTGEALTVRVLATQFVSYYD